MPVLKKPLFLSSKVVAEGQYLDVVQPGVEDNVVLARGIYCLTAVGCPVSFSTDTGLDGTNGAHLPDGDTRLVYFDAPAGGTLYFILAPDGTAAGKLNVSKVHAVPELFYDA
jgi:hypothetical protein